MIESSLKSGLARHTAIRLNEVALDTILNHFESTNAYLTIPADIANMEQMLCVIRSVLETKPATGLTKNELQSLSALLLRVRYLANLLLMYKIQACMTSVPVITMFTSNLTLSRDF